MRSLPIAILAMLLISGLSFAEDYVAINSHDGRDVLSGVFYANVKGLPVKFMPSTSSDADIFAAKVGANHSILLIQGNNPMSGFVESTLKSKGNTIQLYSSDDGAQTNLDLAKLSGAKSFIIVDSAYSDSALSVLPYAAMTKSYVILADKNNSDDILPIVSGKKVIIYGYVDQSVREALSSQNPQQIGKGDDKYADNVAMCQKLMSEFGLGQFMMVDGTFIEEGMAQGAQGILLSGRVAPQPTYDFVKDKTRSGELKQIMVLGNEYSIPAYDMREKIEIELLDEGINESYGLIVKFAQVVPSMGTTAFNLDKFYLPAYKAQMELGEVVYNDQSGKLMVGLDNQGDGPAYYTLEVRVTVDGADYRVYTASSDPELIERGQQLGKEYDLDLSGLEEGQVGAAVVLKFGSSRYSLDDFRSKEGPLATVSYVDESKVTPTNAKYDAANSRLLLTLKNERTEPVYVYPKVQLIIGGSPSTVTGTATRTIEPNSILIEEFPIALSDSDVAANEDILVKLDYGAREGFLLKHEETTLPLAKEAGMDILLIGGILLLLIIAVGLVAFFVMKRKG